MKQILECKVASIGGAISLAEGIAMTAAYKGNVAGYTIGVDILAAIMRQPGCAGIRLYNAVNEMGEETLVYVGVNADNRVILEYAVVGEDGELIKVPGIVADRLKPPRDENDFEWGLPE